MRPGLRKKLVVWAVGISIALAIWIPHFVLPGLYDRGNDLVFDAYQRAKPREWANSSVVIVEIDQESIEEKRMTQEFFEDITNLTKKINTLEGEKINLQQQISEKNKIINSLKSTDYKKSYESAISKLKMINHSYQELEEMYINLLKRTQKVKLK